MFARTLGSKPLVGVLQSWQEKELTLAAVGHPSAVVVPRQEVTRIDRSGGRHSRGRRAIRGAGLGLLAGLAIGLAGGNACDGQEIIYIVTAGACSAGTRAAVGAILGVPAGALIGLAVPPGEVGTRSPESSSFDGDASVEITEHRLRDHFLLVKGDRETSVCRC